MPTELISCRAGNNSWTPTIMAKQNSLWPDILSMQNDLDMCSQYVQAILRKVCPKFTMLGHTIDKRVNGIGNAHVQPVNFWLNRRINAVDVAFTPFHGPEP